MSEPAMVRLAQASTETSRQIDSAPPGLFEGTITFECAQVPSGFGTMSPVWLWLGSDNNKGVRTDWKQGIRAVGMCVGRTPVHGDAERSGGTEITLDQIHILPESIDKMDLLQANPAFYARELSRAKVVGLNNYASQVVQVISAREFWAIGHAIEEVMPETGKATREHAELLRTPPDIDEELEQSESQDTADQDASEPLVCELPANDPILATVEAMIEQGNAGGILFVGSPGTGKSWYARNIGIHLAGGDRKRLREIQFHPSYQYEDFIEGYVPDGSSGFEMKSKHLLEMAERAARSGERHVLVIDELSRTDPARVMGEAMTYIDPPMRGKKFFLRSGRQAVIPPNLIVLATMNPDDRSVDELDDAMDRRWARIELKPNHHLVRRFLNESGMPNQAWGHVIQFFNALQGHVVIGHALFRALRGPAELELLWHGQLKPLAQKKLGLDATAMEAVSAAWQTCRRDVLEAVGAVSEVPSQVDGDTLSAQGGRAQAAGAEGA